ncbi:hypothetical protein U1Q18_027601 [Sarracenia purpurea var. burkii]
MSWLPFGCYFTMPDGSKAIASTVQSSNVACPVVGLQSLRGGLVVGGLGVWVLALGERVSNFCVEVQLVGLIAVNVVEVGLVIVVGVA